jgi:integral membrane protein (TIGR00529 family)
MLYKRLNLGITLNATAIILALLGLSWQQIPTIVYETSVSLLTISIVVATFGIMWLSQLYRETGFIERLSESLGRIIKNPKVVMSMLPAVVGLLPVAGGALMSAPLVESEGEKLKISTEKKAYINLWFRHVVFPVYPLSQVLILTAALSEITVPSLVLLQIPTVTVMIIVGYVIGFWKTSNAKIEETQKVSSTLNSNLKTFFITFFPILITIIVAVSLELIGFQLSKLGFDVLIATFVGILVLVLISRLNFRSFVKPLRNWGIYGVTLAAYGAFLLGNIIKALGISQIFESIIASGSVDNIVLLTAIPMVLGLLTSSSLGGVSISIPLLGGILVPFSPKMTSLIYMSSFLGYVIAPTHLCLAFTVDYFKCPIKKAYKYLLPSFLITLTAAILVYLLA